MNRPDERGISIAELTIGMFLLLVAAIAGLGILASTQRTVRMGGKETESLDGARIALERMVNEIREAAEIRPASVQCPVDSCLVLTRALPAGGTVDIRYRYLAASSTLLRSTGDWLTGAWSSEVPAVTDVRNGSNAVFCRGAPCTTPSEAAVRIVLDINTEPSKPAQQVRLQSYVSPRNL